MLTPLDEYSPYFSCVPTYNYVNPYINYCNTSHNTPGSYYYQNTQSPQFNHGFRACHSYSVKSYSGLTRKLPDFRVDSILDKPIKVDEVSTSSAITKKLSSSSKSQTRKRGPTILPQAHCNTSSRSTRSQKNKISASGKFLFNTLRVQITVECLSRRKKISTSICREI